MKPFFSIGPLNDESAELIERFHYSKRVPSNVQAVGCWREPGGLFGDKGRCIAACVFSIPPTRWSEDVWELSRLIRRDESEISLTGLIAECCDHIRRNKSADLLVSFADPTHGHHGGIYQAASWNFHIKRDSTCDGLFVNGQFIPGRSLNSTYGTRSATKLGAILSAEIDEHWDAGKYLYWRALNHKGKSKASRLGLQANAYPKPGSPN